MLSRIGKKYQEMALLKLIVLGLIIGIFIAVAVPTAVPAVAILGDLFVKALKGIAPILVFILVMNAMAQKNAEASASMKPIVKLYVLGTFFASLVGVSMSFLFPTTLQLQVADATIAPPSGIVEVLHNLLMSIVDNPVNALVNANYIGILAWAILAGVALHASSDKTKTMIADLASAVTKIVKWIIRFAPFGIMGLAFDTVSNNGMSVFKEYGKLLMLLVGTMLFIYFVTNPILVFWCTHKNPYPLVFRCLKKSALTAFFTRSSAANIPINMKECEDIGLDRDTYSVTIPLGATINMDGAAITITVMTLAAANTLGITVDIPSAILLSILAALSACGASGVAGGSLLLIPMACSLFGIPNDVAMQVVGIGFIIGVIQDSVETALNSSSDLLLSASAEFRQWRKEGRDITY